MVECEHVSSRMPTSADHRVYEINDGFQDDNSSDDDLTTDGTTTDDVVKSALERFGESNESSFGNIAVNNSTDVHFGNKTVYHGPVTIKQFVYANGGNTCGDDLDPIANDGHRPSISAGQEEPAIEPGSDNHYHEQVHHSTRRLSSSKLGHDKARQWKRLYDVTASRRSVIVTTMLGVAAVVLLATLLGLFASPEPSASREGPSEEDRGYTSFQSPDTNTTIYLSGKLRIIGRDDWLAQPPSEKPFPLTVPVPYVIISHTASEPCVSQGECTFRVRNIQSFHMDGKKYWDIAYNFLVGGDGYAYWGRGWDQEAAHTFGYNNKSIGISFIGTFIKVCPPAQQLLAAKQLIALGVKLGKIQTNYTLLGHKQLSPTESPGAMLYEEVTTWPHWNKSP